MATRTPNSTGHVAIHNSSYPRPPTITSQFTPKGNFTELRVKNLEDEELKAVGQELQPGFRKLLAALAMIQEVVTMGGKEERYSLVYENGEVKMYKRSKQDSCLPEDVLARFD